MFKNTWTNQKRKERRSLPEPWSSKPVPFVRDTDSVLFLDTGKDEEAFFNTLFNFMILEIYKGDMCHSVMEDAQNNF